MHAEMRRMPVERARHAKRLGHAGVGSGPNFAVLAASSNDSGTPSTVQQSATSVTPTSAQTPTSTHQSSSSALPSSSPTQSSSTSTSSISSPTSSVAVSTDTQSPTSSSSLSIQPSTSLSTVSIPSSTSTPQANSPAASNTGLSGGALAGIIAGSVIVGVAIIVFFIRKTYLRRRERKRISWTGVPGMGAGFSDEPKLPDLTEQPPSFTGATNAQRSAPLSPFEPHGHSMYSAPVSPVTHMHPPAVPTYGVPTPPPATFNNPSPVAAYPMQPAFLTYGPGTTPAFAVPRVAGTGIASTLPGRAQSLEAKVKCTFIPNLPDELSITTGERIFVIEQYDDGWALCANGRGERGMVPRECLDLTSLDQPDMGWGNMRRMSSLNPDGQRF